MEKLKAQALIIEHTHIHGRELSEGQIITLALNQRQIVETRMNAMLHTYGAVPPEIIWKILADELLKSHSLN